MDEHIFNIKIKGFSYRMYYTIYISQPYGYDKIAYLFVSLFNILKQYNTAIVDSLKPPTRTSQMKLIIIRLLARNVTFAIKFLFWTQMSSDAKSYYIWATCHGYYFNIHNLGLSIQRSCQHYRNLPYIRPGQVFYSIIKMYNILATSLTTPI